jgi:hypothetical protein
LAVLRVVEPSSFEHGDTEGRTRELQRHRYTGGTRADDANFSFNDFAGRNFGAFYNHVSLVSGHGEREPMFHPAGEQTSRVGTPNAAVSGGVTGL